MLVLMLVGGLIGMVLQFIITMILMPFFGAFEVMIPLSLIGMPAGMMGAMCQPVFGVTYFDVLIIGELYGLLIAYLVYRSNLSLTGTPS